MREDWENRRAQAEALYAASNWADAEPAFAALRQEGPEDGNLIHDHAGPETIKQGIGSLAAKYDPEMLP